MIDLKGTQLTAPYILTASVILYIAYRFSRSLYRDARIRKLGARAPTRTSYLPWGLDLAYDAVSYAMRDETYIMWTTMFEKWCGPGRYTVEAGVGERVILTAEPDNIKAILATQFKDYGKGEKFREDWHRFLGNGKYTLFRMFGASVLCGPWTDGCEDVVECNANTRERHLHHRWPALA